MGTADERQRAGMRRTATVWTAFLAIFLSFLVASPALPAQTSSPKGSFAQVVTHPPVITHHTGTFNGQQIRYTATVESIDVPDAKGNPAARLVSFAYTRDDHQDAATRPVMFVFNGGPITASLWLHIGVMGPKRVAVPEDLTADPKTYQLV